VQIPWETLYSTLKKVFPHGILGFPYLKKKFEKSEEIPVNKLNRKVI
jgi:hypothetical protein